MALRSRPTKTREAHEKDPGPRQARQSAGTGTGQLLAQARRTAVSASDLVCRSASSEHPARGMARLRQRRPVRARRLGGRRRKAAYEQVAEATRQKTPTEKHAVLRAACGRGPRKPKDCKADSKQPKTAEQREAARFTSRAGSNAPRRPRRIRGVGKGGRRACSMRQDALSGGRRRCCRARGKPWTGSTSSRAIRKAQKRASLK